MEKDLDKLGTVLAVSNQINRDMLAVIEKQQAMVQNQHKQLSDNYNEMRRLLDRQQRRQAWIIITSLAAVVAVVVCSYLSTIRLADRIDSGVEVLQHAHQQTAGTRLPK